MGLLAVFCTNAINIYAGINGIEVGQSFIIACAIFIHNLVELHNENSEIVSHHEYSLTIIIPFIILTASLLKYN